MKNTVLKSLVLKSIAASVLLSVLTLITSPAIAQTAFDTGKNAFNTNPASAVKGSTSERTSAWNNFAQTDQIDLMGKFNEAYNNALKQRSQRDTTKEEYLQEREQTLAS